MLNTTARCDQPSLTMIGECKACTKQFCSTHRLPEDHTCGELASVKEAARQLNSDKLTKDSVAAGANLHSALGFDVFLSPTFPVRSSDFSLLSLLHQT